MLGKNWVFVIGGTAAMAIAVVLFAGCIDEGAPPEEPKVTLTAYFSAPKER